MARCIRGGNSYKRHKIVNGVCEKCGGIVGSEELKQELIARAIAKMKEVNG